MPFVLINDHLTVANDRERRELVLQCAAKPVDEPPVLGHVVCGRLVAVRHARNPDHACSVRSLCHFDDD